MRHSASTRIVAAMIAVWFGFLTIQSPFAAPCPHHQPALAELAAGMGPTASTHAMHGMSRHDKPAQKDSPGHPCDCVGVSCFATVATALVQSSTQWFPEPAASEVCTGITSVVDAPAIAAPHTLPFSTAPPTPLLA